MGKLPSGLVEAGIVRAFRHATSGTILAARLAMQYGIAINIGGGYHHAKPDAGEGFCVYADMPIAIRVLAPQPVVLAALKKITGEDFGYDAEAWRAWRRRVKAER